MLTDDDLKKIGEVVDKKISSQLAPIRNQLGTLSERLDSVDKRLDSVDKRVGNLEEIQKKQGKDISKIRKDLSVVVDYFDKKEVALTKRVEKIEEHLGLTA